MNSSRRLPAGTKFHTSVFGHRDFVYPGMNSDTLIEDANVKLLHFCGGGSKAAVFVPEHAVKHNGSTGKNIIIWVEKEEIL